MSAISQSSIRGAGTPYRLMGSPTAGLVMGTWGFFIGFAAVSLYGPAAKYFQDQMHLSGLALGLLVAAPQLTGSLMRIPFGAWVDRVGGRLPMLTLFCLSLVGMWGLVFILLTAKTLTVAAYPIIIIFGFLSGCGVASFSVGIPQVSYWYPQSRQGTVLGAYGGIGNLAPGIFTLLLPYAIAAWGLAGSYFAWFSFLLLGTGIYAWLTRDAYYFQLRQQGLTPTKRVRLPGKRARSCSPKSGSGRRSSPPPKIRVPGAWSRSISFPLAASWRSRPGSRPTGSTSTTWTSSRPRCWAGLASPCSRRSFACSAACCPNTLAANARQSLLLSACFWGGHAHLHEDFYRDLAGELLIALGMGVGNAAVFKMVPKYVPDAVGGAAGLVGGWVRSAASSFRRSSAPSSMRSELGAIPAAFSPMSCWR